MEALQEQTDFSDLSKLTPEVKAWKLKEWRKDPVLYFIERLGFKSSLDEGYVEGDQLDAHEKSMLRALPEAIVLRKPVVVTSANAMGKDFTISGRASLWFFECWGPCKVIQTATGERQVLDIMWNELKSAYNKRPAQDLMGKMTSGKLEVDEEWFITAFTTKEQKDQPGKFQGVHSPRLMIIVSEAQGVDDIIFEQIKGLTMAGIILPVFLGNPLTNIGEFAKMIEDPVNNIVIRLDAYDCINVKLKKTVIPGLVNWDWVEARRKEWDPEGTGKDPRWQARVRGMLPTTSINSVISKDLWRKCIDRQLSWWSAPYGSIGVDVALTGTDDMVIEVMISGEFKERYIIPKCEAPEACAAIAVAQKAWVPNGGCEIVIDSDGVGGPVAQFYKRMVPTDLSNPINVIEFHGSSTDKELVDPMYSNTRAQAEFYAKDRMTQGHISFPDDDLTREEATATLQFTNSRGKIQIEDKGDLTSRLHRSPDRWNARVLTIWGFKTAQKIKPKDVWGHRQSSSLMAPTGGSAMSA